MFGEAGAGADEACVRYEDAVNEVASALPGMEKKRRPPRAREAVRGLIAGGHLQRGLDDEQDEWLWL